MLNEEKNKKYIEEFKAQLVADELGTKEIKKYMSCVSGYIVFFLGERLNKSMVEGVEKDFLNQYFGDYFINKTSWSSPEGIAVCLACLDRFYKVMVEKGHMTNDKYDEFSINVVDNRDHWIEICKSIKSGNIKEFFGS